MPLKLSLQLTTVLFFLVFVPSKGAESRQRGVVQERNLHGRYRDLFDLCGRVDSSVVNKTQPSNLTKAGALDTILGEHEHRGALFAGIERAVAGAARLADRRSGQKNLFAAFEDSEPEEEPAAILMFPRSPILRCDL